MKLSLNIIAASIALFAGQSNAFSVVPSFTNGLTTTTQHASTSKLNMFGGGGALQEEDEIDEEQEAQIEQAASALGFSKDEYKLVIKMQQNLAKSVDSLRCKGGSDAKGVSVTMDGNSPPKFLEVEITDDGKALGKGEVESLLVTAIKDANEQARKGQAAAIQTMNQDIASEMKMMGGGM